MSGKITVMAHLVAGYPDDDAARAAARGLAEGGVSYFEVQFPFSDPSADGKAIQTACAETLARGFRVADGFAFAHWLRREFPGIPVFAMSYANLVYRSGVDSFAERAAEAGISALIVPDLPFDADEGLEAACRARGLSSVPVAAPSMPAGRIASLAALGRPYVYAALRAGITGKETSIDGATIDFIDAVGSGGSRVLGGFGIRGGAQAAILAPHVHAVVAGSVFVDAIAEAYPRGEAAIRQATAEKARELTGGR